MLVFLERPAKLFHRLDQLSRQFRIYRQTVRNAPSVVQRIHVRPTEVLAWGGINVLGSAQPIYVHLVYVSG